MTDALKYRKLHPKEVTEIYESCHEQLHGGGYTKFRKLFLGGLASQKLFVSRCVGNF